MFNTHEKYIARPYDLDMVHCNLKDANSPRLGNSHVLRPYHWSDVWTAISGREVLGSASGKFKRYLCNGQVTLLQIYCNVQAQKSFMLPFRDVSLRSGVRRVWHAISPHPGREVRSGKADLLFETKYFIHIFRLSRRLLMYWLSYFGFLHCIVMPRRFGSTYSRHL